MSPGRGKLHIEDLEKLSRAFRVSILSFFPREDEPADEQVNALLWAAKQLKPQDLEELRRYAEFRKSRSLYAKGRPGRKGKQSP